MKYGTFIAIILVVLIGLGLCLGRLTTNSFEKGYEAGSASILEDWSSFDHLDHVRSSDGLDEIVRYVGSKDPNAIFDYIHERYTPEELTWVRDAANDGYEAGRSSILDDWSLSAFMAFLNDRYGTYEILDYLHSKNPLVMYDYVSDHYIYSDYSDNTLHAPLETPSPTLSPLLPLAPSVTDAPSLGSSRTIPEASMTVYITATGSKYHRNGCSYLSKSKIAISLSDAKAAGYTPCSRCW